MIYALKPANYLETLRSLANASSWVLTDQKERTHYDFFQISWVSNGEEILFLFDHTKEVALLKSSSTEVIETIKKVLPFWSLEELHEIGQSKDIIQVLKAVRALTHVEKDVSHSTVMIIEKLLEHPDELVRQIAIESIVSASWKSFLPVLKKMQIDKKSPFEILEWAVSHLS